MKPSAKQLMYPPRVCFEPKGSSVIEIYAMADTDENYQGYKNMELFSKIRVCPGGYHVSTKITSKTSAPEEPPFYRTWNYDKFLPTENKLTLLYMFIELEKEWWQYAYGNQEGFNPAKIHSLMFKRMDKNGCEWNYEDGCFVVNKTNIGFDTVGTVSSGAVYRENCGVLFKVDMNPQRKKKRK